MNKKVNCVLIRCELRAKRGTARAASGTVSSVHTDYVVFLIDATHSQCMFYHTLSRASRFELPFFCRIGVIR